MCRSGGVWMFTVGQVARAAGVSTKAVRLYEARGLLPVAARTAAGYRVFQESDVDTVRFIRRVRSLGLGLDAAADILAHPPQRSSAVRTDRATPRTTHRRDRPHAARVTGAARDPGCRPPHRPHRGRSGQQRQRQPGWGLPDDRRRHHGGGSELELHPAGARSSSNARTRNCMSSRIGRTCSMGRPAGSVRFQSR